MARPLESRVYKYKNPATSFFCPLCRTERAVTTSPRLTLKNYLQIFLSGYDICDLQKIGEIHNVVVKELPEDRYYTIGYNDHLDLFYFTLGISELTRKTI